MRTQPEFNVSLLEPATSDAALRQDIRDFDTEIKEPIYQVTDP
jgi:hypothetical protein